MSKLSRTLAQLNRQARRLRPGSVPGALVDVTTGGAFVRPIATGRGNKRTTNNGPSRWM